MQPIGSALPGSKRPRPVDDEDASSSRYDGVGPISAARIAAHKKQEVRDEEGRQRFHGAFTGGFSAGYFNTVGSKEGWSGPASFTSSRSNRHGFSGAGKVQQYMDEEDEREMLMGGSGSSSGGRNGGLGVNEVFAGLGQRGMIDAKKAAAGSSSSSSSSAGPSRNGDDDIPAELLVPTSVPIGKLILQNMGWRPGQPLGPLHLRGLTSERTKRDYGLDATAVPSGPSASVETLQSLWDAAASRFPDLDALGNSAAGYGSTSSSSSSKSSASFARAYAGVGYKPPSNLRSVVEAQRRLEEGVVGGASSDPRQQGSKRRGALLALGMGGDHYDFELDDDDNGDDGGAGASAGRLMMGGLVKQIADKPTANKGKGRPLSIRDAYDDDMEEGGEDQVGLLPKRGGGSGIAFDDGGSGRRTMLLDNGSSGGGQLLLTDRPGRPGSAGDGSGDGVAMLTENLSVFVRSSKPIDAEIAALAKKHPYPYPLESFPANYRTPAHVFPASEHALFAETLAKERQRIQEIQERQYNRELASHFPGLAGTAAAATTSSMSAPSSSSVQPTSAPSSGLAAVAGLAWQACGLAAAKPVVNSGSSSAAAAAPSRPGPPGIGRSSRVVTAWVPSKLLLKRCNIADPLTKEQRRAADAGEAVPSTSAAASAATGRQAVDPIAAAVGMAAPGAPQQPPQARGPVLQFREFVESSSGPLTASSGAPSGPPLQFLPGGGGLAASAAIPPPAPAPAQPAAPRRSRWDNMGPAVPQPQPATSALPVNGLSNGAGLDDRFVQGEVILG